MQVMISAFQPQGEVSGHNFSDIRQISKGQKVKQNGYIYSTICDGLGEILIQLRCILKTHIDHKYRYGL